MRFGNEILCLALAITTGFTTTTTVTAFSPPPSTHKKSLRMGEDLVPKDLIASNMKKRSAFVQTNTLRWEIRSTLTNADQEEAKTTETDEKKEEPEFPPFPEKLKNGIYEIQTPEQHA